MSDTNIETAQLYRRKLLERSNEERLKMGVNAFESARAMVLASLPDGLSESEIRCELLVRFYGNELDPATMHRISKSM